MLVVFLVATYAILGCLLEHGVFVALLALHFGVFSKQGKATGLMVKLCGFFPIFLRMAIPTFFAERLLVLVVLLVARNTLLTQLYLEQWTRMTIAACGTAVLAT